VRAAGVQGEWVKTVESSVELDRLVMSYELAFGAAADYVAQQVAIAAARAEEERAAKAARIGGGGGKGSWGAGGTDGNYGRGSGSGGYGGPPGFAGAQGGWGPGSSPAGGAAAGGKGKGKGGLRGPCFHLLRTGWCRATQDWGQCDFVHASKSGKTLCAEHFLTAGGCSKDGACGLAHDVQD
jgi:hypothetical protein